MDSSDGFRHWGFWFSVPVSITETWQKPALEILFERAAFAIE